MLRDYVYTAMSLILDRRLTELKGIVADLGGSMRSTECHSSYSSKLHAEPYLLIKLHHLQDSFGVSCNFVIL